jgi:splicing factor 1
MAWRNQGITGSNNIPLGNRRRIGGDDNAEDGGEYNPAAPATGMSELKRGRSPVQGKSTSFLPYLETNSVSVDADGQRRKRRNRWGDVNDNKAAGLMGLTTAIYAKMTTEQLDAYTLHLRIEEITQKLKINDVVPGDGDRYVAPLHVTFFIMILTYLDRLPRLRNTTTTDAVSTRASFVTASVSRTSATNL